MDNSTDLAPQPADYYRRKAARAREVAAGVTTRAVKARLLDLAVEYDRLADYIELHNQRRNRNRRLYQ